MPTETTADAKNSYIDAGPPLTQTELDNALSRATPREKKKAFKSAEKFVDEVVMPELPLSAPEMNEIAENIALRVFYDVLKDNYGAEFADVVSEQVVGGKHGSSRNIL